ncbi:MAG: hypothetical protein ACI9NY_000968 [Kiritimatiellia bacterium]|jgi:hypothetical protein
MSSLIPERPLLVFPSLAATIGLEEAVLLSRLDELSQYQPGETSRGYLWHEFSNTKLSKHLPFWDDLDIQRISQRLRDLGIILLLSAPYEQSKQLKFAFNQQAIEDVTAPPQQAERASKANNFHRKTTQGATLLPSNWRPDRDTLAILSQLNIPEHFIREQLPEFVHYWRERGESQRTWGTKFVQHLKRQWTHHVAKTNNASALPSHWQASDELQRQIIREGIPDTFVQKSLQRFGLYHKSSGAINSNWDMPFFSWLKEDWEKQDAPFLDKKKSTAIAPEWQPDTHTLTYLANSQGIDPAFIDECVPEFVHKWIEKNAIHSEWGTLFAEHIIQQWRFVQAGVSRNPHPQLITPQWQPSADCLEVLGTQSGINPDFIRQQVAEFILYWTNRAQPMHSWDNIFLRHIKHQWKQHYEKQQSPSGSGRTKDRTVAEQLSDRSWAS